jgi:hypothetical protein
VRCRPERPWAVAARSPSCRPSSTGRQFSLRWPTKRRQRHESRCRESSGGMRRGVQSDVRGRDRVEDATACIRQGKSVVGADAARSSAARSPVSIRGSVSAQLRVRAGAVVSRSDQRTLSGDHLSLRGDGVHLHPNAASARAVDAAGGRDLATRWLQVAKRLSGDSGYPKRLTVCPRRPARWSRARLLIEFSGSGLLEAPKPSRRRPKMGASVKSLGIDKLDVEDRFLFRIQCGRDTLDRSADSTHSEPRCCIY